MPHRRFRRGIYLLPTLFTVGNLYCGFSSVIAAGKGELGRAAVFIIIAGILDALDGRIARLTGTSSEFGLEFDSLADIVSFGVAPAFLVYQWSAFPAGKGGLAFLFVACAAMRLARFNIRAACANPGRFFAGLPSPPAAGLVATMVFAFPESTDSSWIEIGRMAVVLTTAMLMVSRFRYRSFKDFDLRNRRSYIYVLAIVAVIVLVRVHPQAALLTMAAVYASSGPALALWGLVTRRRGGGTKEFATGSGEVVDEPASR